MTQPVQPLTILDLARTGALVRLAEINNERDFLHREFPDLFTGQGDMLASIVIHENGHAPKKRGRPRRSASTPEPEAQTQPLASTPSTRRPRTLAERKAHGARMRRAWAERRERREREARKG